MVGATEDRTDAVAFARRGQSDRHHFRLVVTPEDAAEMTDSRAFTRDLVGQMESDLSTRLDWVGIAHWNTDNPHVHLVVRGVAISHGLGSRAEGAGGESRALDSPQRGDPDGDR